MPQRFVGLGQVVAYGGDLLLQQAQLVLEPLDRLAVGLDSGINASGSARVVPRLGRERHEPRRHDSDTSSMFTSLSEILIPGTTD